MIDWFIYDVGFLLLLAAQVFLFAIGGATLAKLLKSPFSRFEFLPITISEGFLLISFFAAVGGMLDLVAIPGLAIGVLIFQIIGAYAVLKNSGKIFGFLLSHRSDVLSLSLLFLIATGFWTYTMVDLPILVSAGDGHVHLTFLIHMLESGTTLLNQIPIPFSDQFNTGEHFLYYPTGSHTIVAVFNYLIWKLGFITPAQMLKTAQLFILVGVGPFFWWVTKQVLPGQSQLCYFTVGLLSVAARCYPSVPTDHSGFSRLAGYFFIFPLLTGALIYVRDHPKSFNWLTGVLFFGFTASFFYHAGSLGIFSFGVGILLLYQIYRNISDWRRLLAVLPIHFLIAVAGLIIMFVLLRQTGAVGDIDADNPAKYWRKFTLKNVLDVRFHKFFLSIIREDRITEFRFLPQWALRQIFLLAGLIGLLGFRKRLRIDFSVFVYVFGILIISLLLLLTFYSPNPNIFRLGLVFLHHEYRVGESVYFASTLVCGIGFLGWSRVANLISERVSSGTQKFMIIFFMSILAFDISLNFIGANDRMERYSAHYQAPKRSQNEHLMQVIREETGPNALFVFSGRLGEDIQGRTGRRVIFANGDCPTYKTKNCDDRTALAEKIALEFKKYIETPSLETNCMEDLAALAPEVYYLTKVGEVGEKIEPGFMACKNFGVKLRADRRLIWGFF